MLGIHPPYNCWVFPPTPAICSNFWMCISSVPSERYYLGWDCTTYCLCECTLTMYMLSVWKCTAQKYREFLAKVKKVQFFPKNLLIASGPCNYNMFTEWVQCFLNAPGLFSHCSWGSCTLPSSAVPWGAVVRHAIAASHLPSCSAIIAKEPYYKSMQRFYRSISLTIQMAYRLLLLL